MWQTVERVKHDKETLYELQALSLDDKVAVTQDRIIEFYEHYDGNVVVSFSGGKDSTVLLHIARKLYPDMKAVFSNTGLEFPEIQKFVRSFENVDVVRPKMTFHKVVSQYGYPLISKEVADAISYARRNRRGGSVKALPTLGGASQQMLTGVYGRAGRNKWKSSESTSTGEIPECEMLGTQQSRGVPRTHTKRLEFLGKRPLEDGKIRSTYRCGGSHENGRSGNSWGASPERSHFNKDKWLPLVHTPFRIDAYCCNVMKKGPMHSYQRANDVHPFVATMTCESRMRFHAWVRTGCNAYNSRDPKSTPMAFWNENDVLRYVKRENIEICSVYGDVECTEGNCHCTGAYRTGCVFCGFGAHTKADDRFVQLGKTHPQLYEYCLNGGQWVDNPEYIEGLGDAPDELGWVAWNPKKIWVPSAKGLGMRYVFDCVNAIYGNGTIKY